MGLSLLAPLLSGPVSCRKRADDQHRVDRPRVSCARSGTFSGCTGRDEQRPIPARLARYALGVVGLVAVAHAVLTGHSVTAARREAVYFLVDE